MSRWHNDDDRIGGGSERGRPESGPSRLRGLWRAMRFIGGGPVAALAPAEIAGGARLIKGLVRAIRERRARAEPWVHASGSRTIDVEATAVECGVPVDEIETRLMRRCRQTAWQAYVTFGLGWFFFAVWLYRAAHTVWTASAVVTAIEFAPFCAVFFLMAFRCGLENYQLRTRHAATALEYLRTSQDSFWPS